MRQVTVITRERAKQLLLEHRQKRSGHFFGAVFTKKTTGELRFMTARFGVRKWKDVDGTQRELAGTGKQWDSEQDVIQVWDAEKRAWRAVNIEGLHVLSIDHNKYLVR